MEQLMESISYTHLLLVSAISYQQEWWVETGIRYLRHWTQTTKEFIFFYK